MWPRRVEEGFAAVAARQEDELVQVVARLPDVAGAVAADACRRHAGAVVVAGGPVANELEKLGELGRVARHFKKQSEVAVGKPFGGRQIELIGVQFDGMGRIGGQARAPSALRAAGLSAAVGENATMGADVRVSGPCPERAAASGLLNETALLEMVAAVQVRVGASLAAGRFPLVYGGDCAVLLAAVPALGTVVGEAGLVFLDGHQDATSMEASLSGEAANMEVALLLGLTGERAPRAVRVQMPALSADRLAMLGPRDDAFRRVLDVPTLADCVWLRTPNEVSPDPAGAALAAVAHVASSSSG